MTRTYLTFGSLDGDNWAMLEPVEANGSDQALNLARSQRAFTHYAVTTERGWHSGTPGVVERPPVVTWAPLPSSQVTIDEALEEAKGQAREALKKPTSPGEAAAVAHSEHEDL